MVSDVFFMKHEGLLPTDGQKWISLQAVIGSGMRVGDKLTTNNSILAWAHLPNLLSGTLSSSSSYDTWILSATFNDLALYSNVRFRVVFLPYRCILLFSPFHYVLD
jgi:hypothetical protein